MEHEIYRENRILAVVGEPFPELVVVDLFLEVVSVEAFLEEVAAEAFYEEAIPFLVDCAAAFPVTTACRGVKTALAEVEAAFLVMLEAAFPVVEVSSRGEEAAAAAIHEEAEAAIPVVEVAHPEADDAFDEDEMPFHVAKLGALSVASAVAAILAVLKAFRAVAFPVRVAFHEAITSATEIQAAAEFRMEVEACWGATALARQFPVMQPPASSLLADIRVGNSFRAAAAFREN